MRIALLIGANPKIATHGPTVRLLRGRWTLTFEGLKDSALTLKFTDRHLLLPNTKEFIVTEPEFVMLEFSNRGTENTISVFADRASL